MLSVSVEDVSREVYPGAFFFKHQLLHDGELRNIGIGEGNILRAEHSDLPGHIPALFRGKTVNYLVERRKEPASVFTERIKCSGFDKRFKLSAVEIGAAHARNKIDK